MLLYIECFILTTKKIIKANFALFSQYLTPPQGACWKSPICLSRPFDSSPRRTSAQSDFKNNNLQFVILSRVKVCSNYMGLSTNPNIWGRRQYHTSISDFKWNWKSLAVLLLPDGKGAELLCHTVKKCRSIKDLIETIRERLLPRLRKISYSFSEYLFFLLPL